MIDEFTWTKHKSDNHESLYYTLDGIALLPFQPPHGSALKDILLTQSTQSFDTTYGEIVESSGFTSRTNCYDITWPEVEKVFCPTAYEFIQKYFSAFSESVPRICVTEKIYADKTKVDTTAIVFRADGFWTSFSSPAVGFVHIGIINGIGKISDWRIKGKNK